MSIQFTHTDNFPNFVKKISLNFSTDKLICSNKLGNWSSQKKGICPSDQPSSSK